MKYQAKIFHSRFFLFFIIALTFAACRKKYEHCDNARICVKNTGSNKIAYAWNSNGLGDTLNPGQSTCTDAGEYNADPKNQSGEMVYFTTKDATWAIKPTSCNTEKEINQ
jgi:hypothetical protein